MQQYTINFPSVRTCFFLFLLISSHLVHSLRFSSHSLLFASRVDSNTQTHLQPMIEKREGPAMLLFWRGARRCNLHTSCSLLTNSTFASRVAFARRPSLIDLVTSHAMAGWSSLEVARVTSIERITLRSITLFCLRRARESGTKEAACE